MANLANEVLKVLIGDKEVLSIPGNPDQLSKSGNPMPWTTRGFQRINVNGDIIKISINVLYQRGP